MDEDLNQILESHDFVLVDTSFFGKIQEERSLAEMLYEARDAQQLENAAKDIEEENIEYQWQLSEFTKRDNVFIIPKVRQNLREYQEILQQFYDWHNENRARKKTNLRYKSRGAQARTERFKRINKKREKKKEEINEGNYSSHTSRKALGDLNSLIINVERATRLPTYEGVPAYLSRTIKGISEKHYRLLEAAISYSKANPNNSVKILVRDPNIQRVIEDNFPSFI